MISLFKDRLDKMEFAKYFVIFIKTLATFYDVHRSEENCTLNVLMK